MSETKYIERYWRDAKPADAIKEPPMVARFRQDGESWVHIEVLLGYDRSQKDCVWCCTFPNSMPRAFKYCQVYDAPDPGDGWRLIDTANEKWQEGDEIYERSTGTWRKRLTPFQDWALSFNRRRITPAVTYVPFTWEDREQLRGRWMYRDKDGYIMEEVAFRFDSRTFDVVAKHLLEDGWKFLDTGKPVGKEVEA